MTRIIRLKQTLGASPSQWEGETDDGRGVYIRYRFGKLRVCVFDGTLNWEKYNTPVYHEQIGDEWDGVLGTYAMIDRLDAVLDWTGCDVE